ncbi:serine protease [Fimbriimonas ginsengisoli Gsoil 348]|uniref:Serine protease n=1 Tax=Fimbriimonas ginsengisoli Gsoil 348 TaxID=661478 RepID=A0A068NWA7_FIMGI|nr:serine protease [Fimbriimonas ginsengisoli Gsoil 348]
MVSLGVALIRNDLQIGRLTGREQAIWRKMEPSIATLVDEDRPLGAAALISDSGLFVASRAAVRGESMTARLKSGRNVQMTVLARDGSTGLVLLQAAPWVAGQARPFVAPNAPEQPGVTLLAILGTGPIRAQCVSTRHYGVIGKARRFVPLTEFRFEAPAELIGAALVVCEDGEIVGSLNATLRRQENQTQQGLGQQAFVSQEKIPPVLRGLPGLAQQSTYGPGELTVAYTVGSEVVRQVINGFLSPDHKVNLPSLGLICKDNIGGGAIVEFVAPGSSADRAGIRVGDIIQDIAGQTIRDQVTFARVMLNQRVGAKIAIRTSRGNIVQIRDAVVGRAEDETLP